jgi:hypothetical protein
MFDRLSSMSGWAELPSNARIAGLALGVLAVVAAVAFVVWRNLRNRPNPDEIERRRREAINCTGKLGDGEIVDFEGAVIVYQYQVAGVAYRASQDVARIESFMPSDPTSAIGPALVKFDRKNPANSIVLCEEWSGLRGRESNSPPRPARNTSDSMDA